MVATSWLKVWVAYLGGCFAAFHIGKVVASLPLLIADLDLSLTEAGWLVSLFTVISAIVGALMGLLADRHGPARLALLGLVIAALGSLLGSQAESFSLLIVSRLVEGLGFILTIVSCPSLISASVVDRDRPLAMGLWGSFLPVGASLSMLGTPIMIASQGWRGLWIDIGAINLLWAVIIALVFLRGRAAVKREVPAVSELLAPIKTLGPLMLLTGFACYSALYQSVTALLPTMLVTDYQLALADAASLGSLVVMANVVGNVGAGWLIGRGIKPWLLLFIAFLMMGLCASLMFLPVTTPAMKLSLGLVFSACGGMFPGTAFVLAARLAATPRHVALMAGLLLQGSGLGQTLGPWLTTTVVDSSNQWSAAIPGFVAVALLGLFCAMVLKQQASRSNLPEK